MALFLGHTKAAIKLIGEELKTFAFIANLIAQLTMIAYLSYNLITSTGLWYINLTLLVLSLAYISFTFVTRMKEVNKEICKDIKKVLKWTIRVLKLFPISIALYSLSLATTELTPVALIAPIIITVAWLLDIIINVLYLVIEARASLIVNSLVEDIGKWPFVGNWANQLANNVGDTPDEKMDIVREMAAAEKAEWDEKMQREKEEKREERREKIAGFFSNIFKKSN